MKSTVKSGSNISTLTDLQQIFVHEVVSGKCSNTEAARRAGYGSPGAAAYSLLQNPRIIGAIRHYRAKLFDADLANVAADTLRSIMVDPAAPAAARVSAARTVLEVTRELGRGKDDAPDEKPLSEMTAEELAGMIDKWQAERAALAKDITPGQVEILDKAQDRAQILPDSVEF